MDSNTETTSIATPAAPSAARGKLRPFSNRLNSFRVESPSEIVQPLRGRPFSDMVRPGRDRFVFRVSQPQTPSHGTSQFQTSMMPMEESIMVSVTSEDSYYDSNDTSSSSVTASPVTTPASEISSTAMSPDDGYYDSTDFSSNVTTSSTVTPMSELSSTAMSSDDGYYDSTDSSSNVTTSSTVTPMSELSSTAMSSDDGYYDSTDSATDVTTSAASTLTTSTMTNSYSSSSPDTKSCTPDGGQRTTKQGGLCASTMDLGSVCEGKWGNYFEAAESKKDCGAFDGYWCCYCKLTCKFEVQHDVLYVHSENYVYSYSLYSCLLCSAICR